MTIANILRVFLLILGVMLVFQAYWLAATALFPKTINNARDRYKKPISTTLVGLAVIAPTFLIGIAFLGNLPNPLFKAVGFLIGVVPLLLGAIGSAGLCQLIGHGLPAPTDQSQNWKRIWRGGWVLNFCYLLPFAGWFLILPWGLISGCGAFVLSIGKSKSSNNHSRNRGSGQRAPRTTSSESSPPKQPPVADSPRAVRQQRTQIPSAESAQKTKRQRPPRQPRQPKED
jgi:hypothetical protein